MTDVQMWCVFVGKKGGCGVVMLIKAAHLQPIKEPLSFIKANLLKHAARDVKTSRLCCTLTLTHALFISPDQWMVPWPVIPSGMLKDAFRCIWPRTRGRASSRNICAEKIDRFSFS